MRRITFACLVLCASTRAAWGGTFTLHAGSGDIPAGSGCSRVSSPIPTAEPDTIMRCTSAGGSFILNYVFPIGATSANVTPRVRWSSSDSSPAGNVCWQVCAITVLSGQNRNGASFFTAGPNCATDLGGPQQTQYFVTDTIGSAFPVLDVASGSNPSTMSGNELIVQVTRIPAALCSGNSAQNADLYDVSFDWQ